MLLKSSAMSTPWSTVNTKSYPEGITPLPVMASSDADIAKLLTDQQILDNIAIAALNSFQDSPNVYAKCLKVIPTLAMVIQEALLAKGDEPLNVNALEEMLFPKNKNGNGDRTGVNTYYRHGELATNMDSTRIQRPPGIEYWESNNVQRHDSLLRIHADWETAFDGHISDNRDDGDNPSTVYKIACPECTADGRTVSYIEGNFTTTTFSAVIIASKDGVVIKDTMTGKTTATADVLALKTSSPPVATAFEKDGSYYVIKKDEGNTDDSVTKATRRLTLLDLSKSNLPFTEELERVCREEFAKRKMIAMHALEEPARR